jgi:hypothetical protein
MEVAHMDMVMPHDATLQKVLTAIDPSRIPAAQQAAMRDMQEQVRQFLNARYPVGEDLICAPWFLDGQVSGIGTSFDNESALVVAFRHGRFADLGAMKAALLKALTKEFASGNTEVRKQQFSVGLRRLFGTHTLIVNVVPGMETGPEAYQQGMDEERMYLLLHDCHAVEPRLCNLHRYTRLMECMGDYTDVVKLLKAWRHLEGYMVNTYALEILVLMASRHPDAALATTLTQRLRHVLRFSIHLLETDQPMVVASMDPPWKDYLSPHGKTLLAQRWKQLLHALQSPDQRNLRAFLPLFSF